MTADQPEQPGKPDGPGEPHHLDPFEQLDHPHDAKLDGEVLRSKALITSIDLPERVGYRIKRAVLGPPLVNAALGEEKLSKKAALGVLSSDCISSSAYGSEEMLIWLLPVFGLAGFHILLPMTLVVIGVLVIMTLLYREVVTVYTRAGGSYVVARENFGPKIAQIASVALLIDYIVTVAVQAAAGIAAITSIVPALRPPARTVDHHRGRARPRVREPARRARGGQSVRVPDVLLRRLRRTRHHHRRHPRDLRRPADLQPYAGMIPIVDKQHQILSGVAIFYLLKAFANGGASLTGLEAISNGVSAFKRPEGKMLARP